MFTFYLFVKALKRLYGVVSRAMFSILSKSKSLHLDIDTQFQFNGCTNNYVSMVLYRPKINWKIIIMIL